jgi:hypothetical protein
MTQPTDPVADTVDGQTQTLDDKVASVVEKQLDKLSTQLAEAARARDRAAEEADDLRQLVRSLHDIERDLRAQVATLTAERDAATAALVALKGQRVVSAVFGHHKGAPRPFALRVTGEREPRYLGAQWPDNAVLLRCSNPEPGRGFMPWSSIEDMAADFDEDLEVVWLSDEIADLAEMEQERDAARAELAERTREQDDARAQLTNEERRHEQTIGDRDSAAASADALATAIAPTELIGEHSDGNSPWANAVEEAGRLRDDLAERTRERDGALENAAWWERAQAEAAGQAGTMRPVVEAASDAEIALRVVAQSVPAGGVRDRLLAIADAVERYQHPAVTVGPDSPVTHELTIVPRPKMDSDGLVAARCSCGEYESRPGTEATVTKDWRQHAAAKAGTGWNADRAAFMAGLRQGAPAGPLSASEPAEQPDTGAQGTDTAQGRTGALEAGVAAALAAVDWEMDEDEQTDLEGAAAAAVRAAAPLIEREALERATGEQGLWDTAMSAHAAMKTCTGLFGDCPHRDEHEHGARLAFSLLRRRSASLVVTGEGE